MRVAIVLVGMLGAMAVSACSAIVGIGDLTPDKSGSGSGGSSGSGGGGGNGSSGGKDGGSGSSGGGSGSSSGGVTGDNAPFVGQWTITSGDTTLFNCNISGRGGQEPDSGYLYVNAGSTGSTASVSLGPSCDLPFTVSSSTEMSQSSAVSCQTQVDGGTITIDFTAGNFKITSTGKATITLTGSAAEGSLTCSFGEDDVLSK
jgi:hypothetical protein